jgi:tetratricopeptide (TPR) repeat protein
MAAIGLVGATMRYVLVLLAALATAFAASDGNCTDDSEGGASLFNDFARGTLQLAPQPTAAAPYTVEPAPKGYKVPNQAAFEERERRCLATAIYWEARDGPIRRQIGVGQVILNRVRSIGFPQTICGVVYQDQTSPNCQFPFACDGRSGTPVQDEHWALAQKLARQITSGQVWLPELGYALSLETALAIGTSSGGNWADCGSDLEKRLAACNAFIAKSKESSPDLIRAYNWRGDAHYSKGDYDRAIADYDRAIRLGPDYAIAYTARGNAASTASTILRSGVANVDALSQASRQAAFHMAIKLCVS